MQAYSYYRPATGRTLLYSNFGRDEQLSPGKKVITETLMLKIVTDY